MSAKTDNSIQLELSIPSAPDTAPILAATETRLEVIVTRALPAARGRCALLETIWASDQSSAVPVFIEEDHPILCDPVGAARMSEAAAMEAAFFAEAVALQDLQHALEAYDAGGRLVTGNDGDPGPFYGGAVNAVNRGKSPLTFDALADRTAYLRAVRAYLDEIETDLKTAIADGRADAVVALKAEHGGVAAHLRAATGGIRRRRRATARRVA